MNPPALLSVNKGERSYKCMNTEWLVDDDGPLMFRFISKLCKDGKVELVFFTQRQDNRKYVLKDIIFDQEDFSKTFSAIRETIWGFFPNAKVEAVNDEELSSNSYTALPNNRFGLFLLKFMWHFGGLINRLRWFFFRRPPK